MAIPARTNLIKCNEGVGGTATATTGAIDLTLEAGATWTPGIEGSAIDLDGLVKLPAP